MKLKVWFLVIASLLFTFGAPIVTAYFYFADFHEGTVGGSFLYFVLATIFIILLKRILAAIKKQKAGVPKAIFKLFTAMVSLTIIYIAVSYISTNFTDLVYVILSAGGGRLIGFVFELFALHLDSAYVEEIGVI